MRQFWAHGYEASAISDLVTATGLNRASLYAEFGDKRALFLETVRRYDQRHRETFLARLARDNPPREAILAAFTAAAHGVEDAPGGCLLVNTALEVAPHDPETQALVNAALDAVRDFFRARIEAAQVEGTIRDDLDAPGTAESLRGIFLGLRVLHRAGASSAERELLAERAAKLLE